MHEAIEGFNYSNLTDANDVESASAPSEGVNTLQSLVGMMRERAKVDIAKTMSKPEHSIGSGESSPLKAPTQTIYFMDGTSFFFDEDAQTPTTGAEYSEKDNLPLGFLIVFDTNGTKGPNQLSNCIPASGGGIDEGGKLEDGEIQSINFDLCNSKQNRAIRDQFMLRVRGNVVQPVGEAASWALSE